MVDWTTVVHFGPEEFSDPDEMDPLFVRRLDQARDLAGVPFVLTSSYRDGDPRSHGRGKAVDIRARGSRDRFKIVEAALRVGFQRIGVYDRHVHLDLDESLPQEVLWVGESR